MASKMALVAGSNCAEEMTQAQGSVSSNRTLSVQNTGNAVSGHVELARQFGSAHAKKVSDWTGVVSQNFDLNPPTNRSAYDFAPIILPNNQSGGPEKGKIIGAK